MPDMNMIALRIIWKNHRRNIIASPQKYSQIASNRSHYIVIRVSTAEVNGLPFISTPNYILPMCPIGFLVRLHELAMAVCC